MKINKIISGAQTGADRAGIDAAIALDIPYGGKIPWKRRAEDGPISDKYESLEVTPERNYLVRTEANVIESDATIVISRGPLKTGSKRTVEFANRHHKPCLHIDLRFTGMDFKRVSKKIINWIESLTHDEICINIAGSRESSCPGIYNLVYHSIIEVLLHFKE